MEARTITASANLFTKATAILEEYRYEFTRPGSDRALVEGLRGYLAGIHAFEMGWSPSDEVDLEDISARLEWYAQVSENMDTDDKDVTLDILLDGLSALGEQAARSDAAMMAAAMEKAGN